jgi:hypothetical protein
MKKHIAILSLALLGILSCKKEVPPTPPNYGTPHKLTMGVKVNVSSGPNDGIKNISVNYTGAHGEFNFARSFKDTVGHPLPLGWDTSFTAYPGGQIKFTSAVRGYNLKMYWVDDVYKTDTTFVVASPDKANVIEKSIK